MSSLPCAPACYPPAGCLPTTRANGACLLRRASLLPPFPSKPAIDAPHQPPPCPKRTAAPS
ncbi:hypothetical protein GQ55_5G139800 [Panicum hallii var. hallii]|uniref:Uncharacterized protein n=1 Tax=Panicum hallii var. hallii TaxID=1504633 RepID=A0A2T7DG26_9POAL|nr:hypothetical protein GQ55_5G139800 [Panicum hallii var. hallii]